MQDVDVAEKAHRLLDEHTLTHRGLPLQIAVIAHTMAEELKLFCSYCDSHHTQLEFALHKASNSHVKKVQKKVFQHGFSSVCLVCNSALKNFKQLELHVQEKKHTERMRSCLVNSFLSSDKCTCGSCGVAFFNEVVLEAHRLLYLHGLAESPPNTPKLNDVIKQLSGLCGTQVPSNGNRVCKVCSVTFDGVEESVMHLFTPAHVVRLRSSSCIVCKKDFMHASDREAHIKSSKHLIAIEKCSDLLDEVVTQTLLRKGGYPCMFCMIWCNSWLCLEIHLLEKHHSKVSQPVPSRIIFLAVPVGSGSTPSCDESAMRNWKQWRGEALDEGIWCHKCGVTLTSIDEANRHLDSHDSERCQATGTMHSSTISISGVTSFPETYECSVCAMSFKNALMLSAHTACLEHHRRLAAFSTTATVQCCSSCGLLVNYDRDIDSVSLCKEGSILPVKDTNAMPYSLHLPPSQSIGCHVVNEVRSSGVASCLNGIYQSPTLVTANEMNVEGKVHVCHTEENRLLVTDGSNKGCRKSDSLELGLVSAGGGQEIGSINKRAVNVGKDTDRMLVESGPLMNETLHAMSNSSVNHTSDESGGLRCFKSVSTKSANVHGRLCANVHGNGNCILVERCNTNDAAGTSTELNNVHSMNKDSLHSEVRVADGGTNSHTNQSHLSPTSMGFDDSLIQQNKECLPCHDNNTKMVKSTCLADLGVPIVLAATLAPLRNLQESLQSITAIVTESLSSVLPHFYGQQPTVSTKRKNQCDLSKIVDETHLKRVCAERALEAAVQQGLRSASSNAPELANVDPELIDCTVKTMVRHTGDDKGREEPRAVFAVAASLISSNLPDLSRLANEQGPAVATNAQESSGMRTVHNDNTSERAQSSAANVKSGSLSEGLVGDHVSAVRFTHEKMVEERCAQVEVSQLQPDSAIGHPDTQNHTQSLALSPLANEGVKDEGSLQARKPSAPSVNATSHNNSKSESNDDDDNGEDDDYSFLDPTKGQAKWWSSSDSDDIDSMGD